MKKVSLIIALLTLVGCAGQETKVQRDPAYSAVRPVPSMPSMENAGSLYQPGMGNLYTDRRAYRVGDILTVTLAENTNASKSASTTTSKSNEIDFESPTLFGSNPAVNVSGLVPIQTRNGVPISATVATAADFSGEGDSSQSNSLSGSLTVSVVEVLANGYLVVRGEKILSLNQGDEFIRLSGIVRPGDISPDNVVASEKIAESQIIYGGTGVLADANSQGWLSRVLTKLWPF